ncbi:PTS glucose transporter subunit IIA [Escherichia coli]|uniref:PTS glucose transporter subunit IIA n=1 Tax=Escherichia coli TaxID=562 RepID=UPI000BF896C3|nr:PTS glucose transporter subunit IIA [Escherichia coli]PGG44038.1 PTS glucose transporter subunit IIA [Escherichia coli]HBE6971360.1 PTS glucose transporter subunit IIA [Escherichia coli]HBH4718053.1 PTS glucose transporter subunit IIA [Escherichia coli]
MGLLGRIKQLISENEKPAEVTRVMAPLSGEIVPLDTVPDAVFAGKIVGDGIAIRPSGGDTLMAPVSGTIGKILETKHAFSIRTDSGTELFVHFGINTVDLRGEGFRRIAQEGRLISTGDPVIGFDLALLQQKAQSTLTPVIVADSDRVQEITLFSGPVIAGETPVFDISSQ